jgi:hypothetical protein
MAVMATTVSQFNPLAWTFNNLTFLVSGIIFSNPILIFAAQFS